MFALISSNRSIPQKGIVFKQFSPFQHEQGGQIKGIPLNLDMDIKHLKQICEHQKKQIRLIETSKHNNLLQKKQTILKELTDFSQKNQHQFIFVFSGHADIDGNLSIETIDNPEGEILTIEEILRAMWYCQRLQIYIDACYSGKNCQRAITQFHQIDLDKFRLFSRYWFRDIFANQKFDKQFKRTLKIYASSSCDYTSRNTSFGGLLISKMWFQIFGDNGLRQQTKKKFYLQRPLYMEIEFEMTGQLVHQFKHHQAHQQLEF